MRIGQMAIGSVAATRSVLLFLAPVVCALSAVPAFALTTASIDPTAYVFSAEPKAVLMTFADGPTTRGFAWQTDDTVSESKLWVLEGEHGAADASLFEAQGLSGVNAKCEDKSETPIMVHCHQAQIYGLTPGKTYSYRLGGGGHFAYGSFAVRDVSGGEIVILNMNDAQVRSADKLYVWENTVSNATALVGKPDLVLAGGDLFDVNWFYKSDLNGSPKVDSNWFVHPGYGNLLFGAQDDLYRYNYWKWALDMDLALPYLRGVPWALGRGNHDCEGVVMKNMPGQTYGNANGDIYYDHVTAVNWKEKCHSFDYGNVHVVVLPCLSRSDNAALYGNVAAWVENDLKAAQAAGRTDWTIVEMHWGPYTTGDHGLNAGKDGAIAVQFAPIFSQYHVDLVMQAHDHTYSKTLPYKWDADGVYTTTMPASAVVNAKPKTETIGGEKYDIDPRGTYYVIPGCAGHRVGEDGTTYVGKTGAKSYTTRKHKVAVGKITQTSAYAAKGDDASQNPSASMFGVLKIRGETLAYDVYAVATNGNSAPVLFDTLRVKKPFLRAKKFSVTPYVQHPATNAMSLIWFTKEEGAAKVTWWKESGGETHEAMTKGVWAEALTNNQYTADAAVHGKQYRHRIRLTGLETGTRYCYTVELDGGVSYSNTFRTAPGSDTPVRFIYYNDSETEPGDKKTTDWTDPTTGTNRTYYITKNMGYASNIVHMVKREPDLFVIAGDLAAKGGLQKNWDEFWKHNAGGNGIGYNDPAGSVPIMAAIGNHDLQDAEKEPAQHLKLPTSCENWGGGESALERYLSYFEYEPNGVRYEIGDGETFEGNDRDRSQLFHRLDYGPVTLIFLDTNNGDDSDYERDTNTGLFRDPNNKYGMPAGRSPDFNPGSKQYNWLTNNLADAQRKSKFTFVVNHHCPYSIGYHNRTNVVEDGEWLSARAVRILGDTLVRYGVDGWLCGHDEMVEHSRIGGTEILPDGTPRSKTLDIYDMGTAGDGLRGQQKTAEYNPREVWRAHKDCPEVYDRDGVLVGGGKHYGHMEINVEKGGDGRWRCTLTPVYVFVCKDKTGKIGGFDRRIYDDVVTVYDDGSVDPPGFMLFLR